MAHSYSPPRWLGRGQVSVPGGCPSRTRLPRIEGENHFGARPVLLGAGNRHDYNKSPGRQGGLAGAAAGYSAPRSSSERRQRVDAIKRSRRRRHAAEELTGDWNDYECKRKWDEVRREHAERKAQERAERSLGRSEASPPSDALSMPAATSPEPSSSSSKFWQAQESGHTDEPLQRITTDASFDLARSGSPPAQFPQLASSLPREAGSPADFLLRPRPPASPRPPVGANPRAAPPARSVNLQSIPPSQLPTLPKNARLQDVGNKLVSPRVEVSSDKLPPAQLDLLDLLVEPTSGTEARHQNDVQPTIEELPEMSRSTCPNGQPPSASPGQESPTSPNETTLPLALAEPADAHVESFPAEHPVSRKSSSSDEPPKDCLDLADFHEDDALAETAERNIPTSPAEHPRPLKPSSLGNDESSLADYDEDDSDQPIFKSLLGAPVCRSPLLQWTGGTTRTPSIAGSTDISEIKCDPEPVSLASLTAEQTRMEDLPSVPSSSPIQIPATPVAPLKPLPEGRFVRKDLLRRQGDQTSIVELERISETKQIVNPERSATAALVIQNSQRCRQARRELALRRASREEASHQAQRDQEEKRQQQHHDAALVIQSRCRGFLSRRDLQKNSLNADAQQEVLLINENEEVMEQSATDLQEPSDRHSVLAEDCDMHFSLQSSEEVIEMAANYSANLIVTQAVSEIQGLQCREKAAKSFSKLQVEVLPTIDEIPAQEPEVEQSSSQHWECVLDEDCEMDSSREAWEQEVEKAAERAACNIAANALVDSSAKQLALEAAIACSEQRFDSIPQRPPTAEEAAAQAALEVVEGFNCNEEFAKLANDVALTVIDMACDEPTLCCSVHSPNSSAAPSPSGHDGIDSQASEAYPVERELNSIDESGSMDDVLDEVLTNAVACGLQEVVVQTPSPKSSCMNAVDAMAEGASSKAHKESAIDTLRSSCCEALLKASSNGDLSKSISKLLDVQRQEGSDDLYNLRKSAYDVLLRASSDGTLQEAVSEACAPKSERKGSGEFDALRKEACDVLLRSNSDGTLRQALSKVCDDRSEHKADDSYSLRQEVFEVFRNASLNGTLQQTLSEVYAKRATCTARDLDALREGAYKSLITASTDGTLQQAFSQVFASRSRHMANDVSSIRRETFEVLRTASLNGKLQQAIAETYANRSLHKAKSLGAFQARDLDAIRAEACKVLRDASVNGVLRQELSKLDASNSECRARDFDGPQAKNLDTLRKKASNLLISANSNGRLQQTISEVCNNRLASEAHDLDTLRKEASEILKNASLSGDLQRALAEAHSNGVQQVADDHTVCPNVLEAFKSASLNIETHRAVSEDKIRNSETVAAHDADAVRQNTFAVLQNASLTGALQQALSEVTNHRLEPVAANDTDAVRQNTLAVLRNASWSGALQQRLSEVKNHRLEPVANSDTDTARQKVLEVFKSASLSGDLQRVLFDVNIRTSEPVATSAADTARQKVFEVFKSASLSGDLEQALSEVKIRRLEQVANDDAWSLRQEALELFQGSSLNGTLQEALFEVNAENEAEDSDALRTRAYDVLLNAASNGEMRRALLEVRADRSECQAQDIDDHVRSNHAALAAGIDSSLEQSELDVLRERARKAILDSFKDGTLQQSLDNVTAKMQLSELTVPAPKVTDVIDLGISEEDPLLEELGNVINEMDEDFNSWESKAEAKGNLVNVDEDGIVQVAPLNLSLDFLNQECLRDADCCGREAPATQNTGCGGNGSSDINSTWEELVEAECRSQIDVDVPLSHFQVASEPSGREKSAEDRPKSVDDLRELQPAELHWPKWRTMHDRMSERLSTPLGLPRDEAEALLNQCQGNGAAAEGTTAEGTSCTLEAPTKPASQLATGSATEAQGNHQPVAASWVRERWSALRCPEMSRPASRASNESPEQSFLQLTSLDAFRQKLSCVSPEPSDQNVGLWGSMLSPRGGCCAESKVSAQARAIESLPPPPDFDPPVCQEVEHTPSHSGNRMGMPFGSKR